MYLLSFFSGHYSQLGTRKRVFELLASEYPVQENCQCSNFRVRLVANGDVVVS
jgi:hypothetical protein